MKRLMLIAMLTLAPLTLAPLAVQAENPLPLGDAEIDKATKAMEEAAKNLTNILGLVLRSIPQYEMPVVLPNGDILIKRVHKNDEPPASQEPDRSKI